MKRLPSEREAVGGTRDWCEAVGLLLEWEAGREHLDRLLERHEPGRSRWLVMEVFRHWERTGRWIRERARGRVRRRTRAVLRLGLAEAWHRNAGERKAVVHHAVEVGHALGLARAESGFINAVLRRVVTDLEAGGLVGGDGTEEHPGWLLRRWRSVYGVEGTAALVAWNQRVPELLLRSGEALAGTEATEFAGFYRIPGRWSGEVEAALGQGRATITDPFTQIPVAMLGIVPGECVLDLCAAPGGKSRQLAEALAGTGELWVVDRPGWRFERLRENLGHVEGTTVRAVSGRLEALGAGRLPGAADAVLLDVPCSNTGVIRRRPDVRLRIRPERLEELVALQGTLLRAAARQVRAGGRLVYSTCSLEPEENDGVVGAFLAEQADWRLAERRLSFPPECGHDGGGAFLLTKAEADQT